MSSLFDYIYTLLWTIIQPLLLFHPRLRKGWQERVLNDRNNTENTISPSSEVFDIWIQAASGGEAILTNMLLKELPHFCNNSLHILATSTRNTGVKTLQKISTKQKNTAITIRYFPFDNPKILERAFARFSPKLAVLVETELWPGFLMTAHKNNIPVLVINGRMSAKSHKAYCRMRRFFHYFAPDYVLAMSKEDGVRYADLIGEENVEIVPNIKFDRLKTKSLPQKEFFFPSNCKTIVFGSIRKEEEESICTCVQKLFAENTLDKPVIAAIFPKHLQRVHSLALRLEQSGIPYILRSSLKTEKIRPENSVIIWDTFGELADAYALADAAFVGGSLCTWGGHNFLEPLTFGIRPIIGIHWKNFAWIGRELVECGLVSEVHNETELVATLQTRLAKNDNRQEVQKAVHQVIQPMQGGTAITCQKIIKILKEQP